MTFVVTEACIKCKYTDCVATCPVDAFHEGENMLVINRAVCIDCNACVPECPVGAIYAEKNVPPEQRHFIALNEELSGKWPVITNSQTPRADADEWKDVKNKLPMLLVG